MSFVRKINRGVILSFAVVLAIAGYYLAIEIKNAPVKEEVGTLARQFAEIYQEGYRRPKEYRDFVAYPKEKTEQDAKALREKLQKIYVGDAGGIDKWVKLLTTENTYKTSEYQYFEEFNAEFKRVYNLKITGDAATANMEIICDFSMRQDPNSAYSWQQKDTFDGSLTLKRVDGKWLATGISVNSRYF